MLSPRSKRTTAMRPCGPSPFSTFTNWRSMSRIPPRVRATVAPRLYKGEPLRLTAPHVEIDRIPRPRTPRRRAVRPLHHSPARRAPSSPSCAAATIELCKGYGLASIELGVPIAPADALSHRLGQQAVHRHGGADAGGRGQAQALRPAAQVPARADAAAGHHRPDDAQLERPARLPRVAAAGRPRPRQAGAAGRPARRLPCATAISTSRRAAASSTATPTSCCSA